MFVSMLSPSMWRSRSPSDGTPSSLGRRSTVSYVSHIARNTSNSRGRKAISYLVLCQPVRLNPLLLTAPVFPQAHVCVNPSDRLLCGQTEYSRATPLGTLLLPGPCLVPRQRVRTRLQNCGAGRPVVREKRRDVCHRTLRRRHQKSATSTETAEPARYGDI